MQKYIKKHKSPNIMKEKSKSRLRKVTTDILTDKDIWDFSIRMGQSVP